MDMAWYFFRRLATRYQMVLAFLGGGGLLSWTVLWSSLVEYMEGIIGPRILLYVLIRNKASSLFAKLLAGEGGDKIRYLLACHGFLQWRKGFPFLCSSLSFDFVLNAVPGGDPPRICPYPSFCPCLICRGLLVSIREPQFPLRLLHSEQHRSSFPPS